MTDVGWSVSGLCITARPENMAAVEEKLNARPGFEVHARDHRSGRLVAVQECATVEEHRQKLRELQMLPGVLTAELVLYYQDRVDGTEPTTTGARE